MVSQTIGNLKDFLFSFCSCAERTLDIPGYIPIVSLYTAPLRIKLATLQIITALAIGALTFFGNLHMYINPKAAKIDISSLTDITLKLLIHAIFNIGRSFIEGLTPFNLLLISYDRDKLRRIDLYISQLPQLPQDYSQLHLPVIFWPAPDAPPSRSPSTPTA